MRALRQGRIVRGAVAIVAAYVLALSGLLLASVAAARAGLPPAVLCLVTPGEPAPHAPGLPHEDLRCVAACAGLARGEAPPAAPIASVEAPARDVAPFLKPLPRGPPPATAFALLRPVGSRAPPRLG